ncbi:tetratricopeptide repeat protein [Synechococcus sp. AH-551-N17]|nr:tetratricopeptide repeat protein [Synechococcus sp. AH-551-N17]
MTIQELSATGRHQECLQACQSALQVNPEETYAYKYAGKSLLALGQFEKAQQCLVKAHQLDDSDPEILKDIGNIFLSLGNKDAAVQWYEKALEINNNYAPAFNNLANLKRQDGKHQEAIELFKRAIQADPSLIQACVGAAASFLTLGDLAQAESFAAQALAINASVLGVNEILGIVFQNNGNPDQAIECYQRELEVNPQASNTLLNLGLLYLQKGQSAAAVEALSKASALAPSDQCSLLLAQAYQNLGQFKEAIIEYQKLDINKSQNKIIPFNLGLCLFNTGNNIDASEAFKIAIQIDETFVDAWGNIGTVFVNEGRHREALTATQKVLDLEPDNVTAYMNLGLIYTKLGQLDQALASTLKSLELKPENADALMNLGVIYKDLGQLDQALASTLQSLELKPDNLVALMNLAGIYKDLGQLDQLLKTIQNYISITYEQQNLSDPIESILMDQEKLYSFFKDSSSENWITSLGNYYLAITSLCLFERIDAIDWLWIFSKISFCGDVNLPFLHLLPYVLSPDDSKGLCAVAKQVFGNPNRNSETIESSISFASPLNTKNESPVKCLSFGFLSNDSSDHCASPFLYAITSELIKQGHNVNTYSSKLIDCSTQTESSQSTSFKSAKAVSLYGLSFEEGRNLISSEMHDVLIEAEGLTNNLFNMKLLNRHLAPVQLSFLGYPGTTGNPNIDFFLTDKYYKIIDDNFFSERALAIDGSVGARYPIIGAPEPGDCPFTKNGYITFGTLNNSYKITPLSIKIWSKIMLQCSYSRFIFFRDCYSFDALQASINAEFEKNGISSSRISYIDNKKVFASHFDCYNEIDISLDTFPLTGGVTTYDSLWMGVPVITIEGDNIHQRISGSDLRHAGLSELIGSSQEEMIETAVRIASDKSACLRWRNELRSHLLSTDLFNPGKTAFSLAKEIEKIKNDNWQY